MINVNDVYQTVLLILNKEQRGYLTPNEFNKIATQVQLEIFENTFEDLNRQYRVLGVDDEYADRLDHLDEEISIFKEYSNASYYSEDPLGPIENPYFYLPENVFRIGTIMYKGEQAIQATNRGEYLHLNMSKLTRPTTNYPLYIQEGVVTPEDPLNPGTYLCEDCVRIYVYPEEINKDVSLSYVRKPKDVIWAYVQGSLGQYQYEANPGPTVIPNTGSQDFELDDNLQTEVVLRILAYAGVVIRDPQIVQAATQQVALNEANQKS